MFVPTEAIGGIIAKIVGATRMPLETLEFREDKCIVTFSTRAQAKATEATPKPPRPLNESLLNIVRFTLPAGPWTRTDKRGYWTCEGVTAKVEDLAKDRGVNSNVMTMRLTKTGMADTQKHKSKLERIAKRERLSLT